RSREHRQLGGFAGHIIGNGDRFLRPFVVVPAGGLLGRGRLGVHGRRSPALLRCNIFRAVQHKPPPAFYQTLRRPGEDRLYSPPGERRGAGTAPASRASVSSRPSTCITSKIGGETVLPASTARSGCATTLRSRPLPSTKPRTASSIAPACHS